VGLIHLPSAPYVQPKNDIGPEENRALHAGEQRMLFGRRPDSFLKARKINWLRSLDSKRKIQVLNWQ
jgi:hypothetical protein